MKRFLLLQLALLMLLTSLLCVPVNAAKVTDGKFYYELSTDGKYYSIVDCKSTLSGHVDVPKEYKGLPVKVIDHRAFFDCTKITSVTVYKNINTIESYAFDHCTNLSKIVLSDHIKYIDSTAFERTKYYNNKFNWTLKVLYIGKHLIKADKSIAGNFRIKNGTETIARSAFEECSSLTAVVIPNTVHSIPDYAFRGCGKLNHIYLPEGITSIGEEAFMDCGKVDCMTIPSTVTYIGECALPFMDALYIPENVTRIGAWATYYIGKIYGVKGSKAEINTSENSEFVDISTHSHTYETVEHSVASKNTCGIKYNKCTECGFISSYKVTNQLLPGTTKLKSINFGYEPSILIKWDKVSGADQYRVYRKANGAKSWTHIANVTGIHYYDYDVKNNTMYTYTVKAQNEAGSGAYNKTGLKYKCIYAPDIKSVTNTDKGAKISWGKVSGADKYYIFRLDEVTQKWKCIKTTTDMSVTSYLDTTTKAGVRYYYKLRASSGTYKSGDPHVNTPKDVTVYMKSPKLTSAKSTKSGVKVDWGKTAGADSYIIYRKTGSGAWTRLAVVNSGSTVSYLDKTAKKGTTYTYTVKASSCGYFTSSYNKTGLKVKDIY